MTVTVTRPAQRRSGRQSKQEMQLEETARLRSVIDKLSRRLRGTRAGSGLTPSQIAVLFTVVRAGPIGLSELAELEDINPTMLSRITANLSDAGLLERTVDPADKRAARVAATAAGRRMRERIHRERTHALALHVDQLDPERRALLMGALPVLEELDERVPGGRP